MTIELLAPAKINLGLEVLRKRDDGFHDIATVFQTISVFDRLRIEPAAIDSVELGDPSLQIDANLAERALSISRLSSVAASCHQVSIEKRIPIAGGMGGASADAAAVLRGLNPVAAPELATLALELGSDVPFLLQGGAASGFGRGEVLEPLPSLRDCWIVLVCPSIEIERKTARLYGELQPGDFTDGARIERVAQALRRGEKPAPADLANVFSRPLAGIWPAIDMLIVEFRNAGAPFVALSGAGPTQYTIVSTIQQAISISRALAQVRTETYRIMVARPVPSGLQLRFDKTQIAGSAL